MYIENKLQIVIPKVLREFCLMFGNDKCEAIEIFDEVEVYVNGLLIFPTDFETAKKRLEILRRTMKD